MQFEKQSLFFLRMLLAVYYMPGCRSVTMKLMGKPLLTEIVFKCQIMNYLKTRVTGDSQFHYKNCLNIKNIKIGFLPPRSVTLLK